MAHSSRTWTGARTPQAIKRVRQSQRRHAIQQPRRSAAKTYVTVALTTAGEGDAEATRKAVAQAASALDRAAKSGAIHANTAARRKSRLMRNVEAALGGETLAVATGKAQRQVSRAAAAKAAKARIAAGKATKAKGEQTAAGKARAALSKTARTASETASEPKAKKASTTASKSGSTKSTSKPKTTTRSRAKKTTTSSDDGS